MAGFTHKLDITNVKKELQRDILRSTAVTSQANTAHIAALEARLAELNTTFAELTQMEDEIRAQLPHLPKVMVASSSANGPDGASRIIVLVALDAPKRLPTTETERLKRWLKTRMPDAEIHIVVGKLST